jgi:hypothetical protein
VASAGSGRSARDEDVEGVWRKACGIAWGFAPRPARPPSRDLSAAVRRTATGVGPERDRTGTGLPTDGTAEMCARPGAATGDVRAAWCDSEETRARRRRQTRESRARDQTRARATARLVRGGPAVATTGDEPILISK